MDADAFKELAAEAAADGAAAPGAAPGAAPVAEPAADPVKEWEQAFALGVALLSSAYPSVAAVYTEEKVRALAEAVHAVAKKYGFTASSLFERYAPEINLAMVGFPLVKATADAIRADKAKAASAAAPKSTGADTAVGGASVDVVKPRAPVPGALQANQ